MIHRNMKKLLLFVFTSIFFACTFFLSQDIFADSLSAAGTGTSNVVTGRKIVQFGLTANAMIALDNKGNVWTWGRNNDNFSCIPPALGNVTRPMRLLSGAQGNGVYLHDIVEIQGNPNEHYDVESGAAKDINGYWYAWGVNSGYGADGALGNPPKRVIIPNRVSASGDPIPVKSLTFTGYYNTAIIYEDNALYTAGTSNGWGQLARPIAQNTSSAVFQPALYQDGSPVTDANIVATGGSETLFLVNINGDVFNSGYVPEGKFDRLNPVHVDEVTGYSDPPVNQSPIYGKQLSDIRLITGGSAGDGNTDSYQNSAGLAVDNQNRVWVWGYGPYGSLGYGVTSSNAVVTYSKYAKQALFDLHGLSLGKIKDIKSSASITVLVDDQGHLFAAGSNSNGVIVNDPSIANVTEFTPVTFDGSTYQGASDDPKLVSDVVQAYGMHEAIFYLNTSGTLYGRGTLGYGQFGKGVSQTSIRGNFEPIVFPTQPTVYADKLDSAGNVMVDDPATPIDEGTYRNKYYKDPNKKVDDLRIVNENDKHNNGLKLHVERDRASNGDAADFGAIYMQTCELELDADGNEVLDGNGRVVCDSNGWTTPVKVKDDDGTDYEHLVTFEHFYDKRIFRKYRFYYENQVNINYDPTNPDMIQDVYTDFVVDLKRGDIDALVDEVENGSVIRADLVLNSGNVYTNFINVKVGKNITTDVYMEDCSSGTCSMQLSQRGLTTQTIAINRVGTYMFEMSDDYGNKTIYSNVKVYRDHTRPQITAFKIFDVTKPDPDIASDYSPVQYVSGSGAIQSIQHPWINDHLTFTIEGSDSTLDTSGIEYLNLYQLNATGERIGAPLWRYKIASTPNNPITNVDLTLPTFAGNHFNISENGTYEIEIVDYAGNSSVDSNRNSAVKFKVDCIDKEAPVLENTDSPTTRVNNSNQLELQLDVSDTQSLVDTIEYQFVSNSSAPTASGWQAYTASSWLSIPNNFNGRVYVRAKDHAGNTMGELTSAPYNDMQFYSIVNDRTAPTITYVPYAPGGSAVSDDPSIWRNADFQVVVQAEDQESGIEKIEIVNILQSSIVIPYTLSAVESAQSQMTGGVTLTIPVPANGIYHVIAYDFGGNQTTALIDASLPTLQDQQKLVIDHIDKEAPIVSGITLNAAGELMIATNNDGNGSGLRLDPTSGLVNGIEYRIDGQDPWITYDPASPPVISLGITGTFVEVRAIDQVGLQGTLSTTLQASGGAGDRIAPSFGTVHNATSAIWRRGANGGVPIQVDVSDNTGGSGVSTIKVEPITSTNASLVDRSGFPVASDTQSYPASASDTFTFYAVHDGDYKLTMSDVAGNKKTITITVDHVDNEAPSGTIYIGTRNIISTLFGSTKHYFNLQNVQDCANAQTCAGIANTAGVDDIQYQFVKTGDPILPGNWRQAVSGTNYDIADDFTGILYVRIRDAALLDGIAGTIGNEVIVQSYISGDEKAPVLTAGTQIQGHQPAQWVNTPVNVQIDVSDDLSGIYQVEVRAKDGSASIANSSGSFQSQVRQIEQSDGVLQKSYTFSINRNGDYEAVFTDYAGNVSGKHSFLVTHVDMDPPTIKPVQYIRKFNGSADVTLQAEDGNGSGVQGIYYITSAVPITTSLGTPATNANWQSYTTTPLNTSDAYIYVIAKDVAGNYSSVHQHHMQDDFTPPALTTPAVSPVSWVNGSPSLSFQITDTESGIKKVIVRDANQRMIQSFVEASPFVGTKTYTIAFDKSDTYAIEMWDDEGNQDSAYMTITNIDNEKPIIQDIRMVDSSLLPPIFPSTTLDANIRAVDMPTGSASGIKEYRYVFVPHGIALPPVSSWSVYDPANDPDPSCAKTFIGELHVIAYDEAGNASDEYSKTIGGSSSDSQGPLFQILQSGPQSWQKQGTNSVIILKATDTSDIQSMALIDDPSGIASCTTAAGAAGSNEMTITCQIDRNGSYLFEAVDKAGNRSERAVNVRTYDNNAPAVTQMDMLFGNNTLTITLDGDDHGESGLKELYYQIVPLNQSIGSSWVLYVPGSSGSVQLSMQANATGYLIVKAVDQVGNESLPVSKLITTDADKPTVQVGAQILAADQHSAEFPITVQDATSGVKYYTITGPGVTMGYVAVPPATASNDTQNAKVTRNGQYFVTAYDYAGNASDIAVFVASNIDELNSSGSNAIIDIQIVRGNPASQWYAGGSLIPIEITAKDTVNGIKRIEIIDHPSGLTNYAPFIQTNALDLSLQRLVFDVSENGLYTVKVINQNGNHELRTIWIDRFDTEGPQIGRTIQTQVQNGNMQLSIQATDRQSGVDHIYYQLLANGNTLSSSWQVYVPTQPIVVGNNFDGQLVLKAIDKVGNDSEIIYEPLKVVDGNKVTPSPAPSSSIQINVHKPDPSRWYHKSQAIPITIDATDSVNGISSIELIDDTSGAVNYTKLVNTNVSDKGTQSLPFDVVKNGMYTVKVTNQNGDSEVRQFVVDRFDLIAPVIDELSASFSGSTLRIHAHARDEESGIKEYRYRTILADGSTSAWSVFDPDQDISLSSGYEGGIQIQAVDQVGNESVIRSFTIKEDGEIVLDPEDGKIPEPSPKPSDELEDYQKQCEIGKPIQVNVDTDNDGIPDINLDIDTISGKASNDGVPDLNVDYDCDGIPDVNIDTDGDGKADINIDRGDGIPYLNIVKLSAWVPNITYTLADGFQYNTIKGLTPMYNIDTDGDGIPDKNVIEDMDEKGSGGAQPAGNRALVPALGESLQAYWWYYLLLLLISGYSIRRLYKRHQTKKG